VLVHATLRFRSHCLAGKKTKSGNFEFERTTDGKIFFHAAQLSNNLVIAARIEGRCQHLIDSISWVSELVGTPTPTCYRRYDKARNYAQHEAFTTGSQIILAAHIPEGMDAQAFKVLMSSAGRFCGLSAFGVSQGYGKYVVVSCEEMQPPRSNKSVVTPVTTDSSSTS
jgi:hypothetical protein